LMDCAAAVGDPIAVSPVLFHCFGNKNSRSTCPCHCTRKHGS